MASAPTLGKWWVAHTMFITISPAPMMIIEPAHHTAMPPLYQEPGRNKGKHPEEITKACRRLVKAFAISKRVLNFLGLIKYRSDQVCFGKMAAAIFNFTLGGHSVSDHHQNAVYLGQHRNSIVAMQQGGQVENNNA